MAQRRPPEEFELLRRASSDSAESSSGREDEFEHDQFTPYSRQWSAWHSWRSCAGRSLRLARESLICLRYCRQSRQQQRKHRRYWTFAAIPLVVILLLLIFTAIFRPSYTNLPKHYKVLERRCKESKDPGRGNVNNEKVFIAAALYDYNGHLLGGEWGNAVRELVHLLGPENVHVSVYENDADELAKTALSRLEYQLTCNVSLILEHLPLEDIPSITLPTGERRAKRIAFLAEVRNRALQPLHDSPLKFDKLLFINDVIFRPLDAIQLLFSTNIDINGRSQYGAVCALDFINAFKFYDRFATRDLEGYSMGVPFYPWFTDAGDGASRHDVLAQKDAVRVRSCWGGMTAFEASWFQNDDIDDNASRGGATDSNIGGIQLTPLRFRYELDPFWDASECCLIHADLTYLRHGLDRADDAGIYTNPYVRVAYDSVTLSWLPYARRIERVYSIIQNMVNSVARLPAYNPRRLEEPGDDVVEKVWKYEQEGDEKGGLPTGSYHDIKRISGPGRFCGGRALSVLKLNAKEGEKKWANIPLPAPPR